jgi:hypothetical protein
LNGEKKDVAAGPAEKERFSRAAQRQRKEARKKRRMLLAVILAVGAVLAVGAIFDIPYINVARRGGSWLGEKISGESPRGKEVADYLFLTDPRTSRKMAGDVSTLLLMCKGDSLNPQKKVVLYMALFTYHTELARGDIYLVPETAAAYNSQGQKVSLSESLKEEGGADLLRSTVGNITGYNVDYLVTVGFWEAMGAAQNLELPPLAISEDVALPNPTNGDVSHLAKGHRIQESDRLLSYLMATDTERTGEARLERARAYLPEAFFAMRERGQDRLEEALSSLEYPDLLLPGTGDAERDGAYLASMIQAFADLGEDGIAVHTVPSVEVVNGCGVPDLGKRVAERLSSLGVAVSGSAGNAKVIVNGEEVNDFSHQTSSVLYRSDERRVESYARYLAVLMSIGEVKYEPGPGPQVVLVAGRDQVR